MKQKIALVDVSNILHKTRQKIEEQGYIQNLIETLSKIRTDFGIDRVICIQDAGRSRYRQDALPTYKEHRIKKELTPKEQIRLDNFRVINNNMEIFSNLFESYKIWGVEADDIIGMLFHKYHEDYDISVFTVDKDYMTTIPLGSLYHIFTLQPFTLDENRFGLSMGKFKMLQALMGDMVDNIKGVCGEKTAKVLLDNFDNYSQMREFNESVLDFINITPYNKRYVEKALEELKTKDGWNKLRLNYDLISIFKDETKLNEDELKAWQELCHNFETWVEKEYDLTDEIEEMCVRLGETFIVDYIPQLWNGERL